jgi:hypothetical protein
VKEFRGSSGTQAVVVRDSMRVVAAASVALVKQSCQVREGEREGESERRGRA